MTSQFPVGFMTRFENALRRSGFNLSNFQFFARQATDLFPGLLPPNDPTSDDFLFAARHTFIHCAPDFVEPLRPYIVPALWRAPPFESARVALTITYFETGSAAACDPRKVGADVWTEFVTGYLKPACQKRCPHPYFGISADELLGYMIGDFKLLPPKLFYTPPADFRGWVGDVVRRRGPSSLRRENGVKEQQNPAAPPGTPKTEFVVVGELLDDGADDGDTVFLDLYRRESAVQLGKELCLLEDRELRVMYLLQLGLDHKQVEQCLGLNPGHVAVILSRVRARLLDRLGGGNGV